MVPVAGEIILPAATTNRSMDSSPGGQQCQFFGAKPTYELL